MKRKIEQKTAICGLLVVAVLLLAVRVLSPSRGVEAAGVVSRSSTLVVDGNLVPVADSQQITVTNSAVGLTVPTRAKVAWIQVLNYNVRICDDGSDPDASTGIRAYADTDFFYVGDLSAIKFIRETSDAEVNVLFYDW